MTRTVLLLAMLARGYAADLILKNAKIVTLDPSRPQAEAMAITGGKITAVGSNRQISAQAGPTARVLDLGGHLAIPGFIEGHGHFTGLGQAKMNLNLNGATSWDQIVGMVAAAAREAKPGAWIMGRGWHQEKWERVPEPSVEGFRWRLRSAGFRRRIRSCSHTPAAMRRSPMPWR